MELALQNIRHRRRHRLVALAIIGFMSMAWSLCSGAVALTPSEVGVALLRGLAGEANARDAVVLLIRLPRVLFAFAVGAALAMSGAALQGLFRNPLADPGLIGITAGAAFGAVAAIVLGGGLLGVWFGSLSIALSAFTCGLATTWLVYLIGARRRSAATLLLAGVAVTATAGAASGCLIFMANDTELRDLTFWSLGSLGGADWRRTLTSLPLIALPLLWLPGLASALNALLLGETEAGLLGFRPAQLRKQIFICTALAVSAGVAVAGSIGFIGLVVPHLLRLSFGPDHRLLLPGSAIAGGTLLVIADTLARNVVAPAELPIGILTALIGGPFFFWLLLRKRGLEVN